MSTVNETATTRQAMGPFPHKVEVKKVLLALNPLKLPVECKLTGDTPRELRDPIVIMITCGDKFQQLTVSRPVGHHDLEGDDWIVTPTSDVKSLIAAAEDPSSVRKEDIRRMLRDDALVRAGLLLKDEYGRKKYPPTVWEGRYCDEAVAHSKAEWKRASDAAHASYLEECAREKRQPKKNWKFGFAVGGFLPPAVKVYEDTFSEKLKADPVYKAAMRMVPEYKTLAGQFNDQPQVPARLFGGQIRTREQMTDTIKKDLMGLLNGTRMADLPSVPAITQAFKDAGDNPDALKKFILEYAFPYLAGFNTSGGGGPASGS